MINAEPYFAKFSEIPEIKSFYCRYYPDHAELKIGNIFDWLYLRNPLWNYTKLPIIIIRNPDNNQIIGHEGLFRDRMKINNVERTVTWGTDLFVHPDFRGQGIAKKIHSFIHSNEKIYIAISMAQNTRKLLTQFNPISISPIYSYVAILNKSILDQRSPFTQLVKYNFNVIGKLAYYLISKYNFPLDFEFIKKYFLKSEKEQKLFSNHISPANFQDMDFLSFRRNYEKNNNNIHIYSEEIIRWKFIQQPNKEFRLFLYSENGVKGYFILRIHKLNNSIFGIISDFAVNSSKALIELIHFAKLYCTLKECNSLFVLLSEKFERKIFRDNGFFLINMREPLLISNSIQTDALRNIQFRFNYESHDMDRIYNFRY